MNSWNIAPESFQVWQMTHHQSTKVSGRGAKTTDDVGQKITLGDVYLAPGYTFH